MRCSGWSAWNRIVFQVGIDLLNVTASLLGERMDQIVVENVPQRFKSIADPDLLTFFVGAAVIRDRYFISSAARLADHGRDLDFHSEPMARQHQRLDDLAAEGFVTRFDIRHIPIGENVG